MRIDLALSLAIRWVLTIVFAIFALIHIEHIISGGWNRVDLHWELIDVVYGGLAVVVVCGLLTRRRASVIAMYTYSLSQLAIITFLSLINKTWLPYTDFHGQNVLMALAVLHILAIVGEGYVLKLNFAYWLKKHI